MGRSGHLAAADDWPDLGHAAMDATRGRTNDMATTGRRGFPLQYVTPMQPPTVIPNPSEKAIAVSKVTVTKIFDVAGEAAMTVSKVTVTKIVDDKGR